MSRKFVFAALAITFALPLFATAASCPNLTRNLSFGTRGSDVTQLQQFLISQNLLAVDSATGYFGRLTQAAVQKWQCKNMSLCSGSPSTNGYGNVGPKTRAALGKCSMFTTSQSSGGGALPTNIYASPTSVDTSPSLGSGGGSVQNQNPIVPPSNSLTPAQPASAPPTSQGSTQSPIIPAIIPINGTFIEAGYLTSQNIPQLLDEYKSLGMDTIIVQALRERKSCTDTSYSWILGMPGNLSVLLSAADTRGISVYLGTSLFQNYWNCSAFYSAENTAAAKNDLDATLSTVFPLTANHSSFAGWYISEEPALAKWSDAEFQSALPYYSTLVASIKKVSSLPIIVSPHLEGAEYAVPQTVADRAVKLRDTGISIQAWQDSVGFNATSLVWNGSHSLDAFFQTLSSTLGKSGLWADTELFNYGKTMSPIFGGAYHPASIQRINRQMSMESSAWVSKRVVWSALIHMTDLVIPYGTQPEAKRLLADYKAAYGFAGHLVHPSSYSWLTAPDSTYADSGNELFDGNIGNPKDNNDAAWVGIASWKYGGKAQAEVTFSTGETVKWVSVHELNNNTAGIIFPSSVEVSCKASDGAWVSLGMWNATVSHDDSEYVFGNTTPLYAQCSAIQVTLNGTGWIFVSELEIVAQ